MEEDAVHDLPAVGAQAETDVGQPDGREGSGQLLDPANALEGFEPIPPLFFLPSTDRQDERVEQQVRGGQAVFLRANLVDAGRDLELRLRRARHTALVNAAADE